MLNDNYSSHVCFPLCILAIIFCFFPVVSVYNSALNIFQLAFHPDFTWTMASTISLLIYIVIPITYAYVLHGYIHHKNHMNLMIYPTFATSLGILSQILIALIIEIQMPELINEVSSLSLFLCLLGGISRFLTGFLLVIDCTSGKELFVRILERKVKF